MIKFIKEFIKKNSLHLDKTIIFPAVIIIFWICASITFDICYIFNKSTTFDVFVNNSTLNSVDTRFFFLILYSGSLVIFFHFKKTKMISEIEKEDITIQSTYKTFKYQCLIISIKVCNY
jgi:hypothetical protein